jgi:hypothetical protein
MDGQSLQSIALSINLRVVTFLQTHPSAFLQKQRRGNRFVIVSSVDLPFKQLHVIKISKCHQQKGKQ